MTTLIRLVVLTATVACLRGFDASAATGDFAKTQKLIAVLQSDAGLFEKARACQQLGEIGTRDAVPVLAGLLAHDHLSAYARSGLEGIPDPSAAEAFQAATRTLKGNRLAGVINSLGVLRDAKAVSLLRTLAVDPGSGVAREALLALGRIATDEAIQIIRQALADGSEAARSDAAAACLLAAEKQMADGRADAAVALYDAVRHANVPAAHRAGATRGAILARKTSGAPFLIEQLRSSDRVIRHAALITVREMPSDTLASALNAELANAPPELQVQLLAALIDCHNQQSLQVVKAKTASDDPEIRKSAVTVLARIGGPAEAEILLKTVTDHRSPDESSIALSGLARIEGAVVDEQIVQALSSATDQEVRVQWIRLVEARGMTHASRELLRQAAASESRVSGAALAALKSLAGPEQLPALIALTRTCQDDVRDAAENTLASVCTRTGQAESGGERVLAELKRATAPAERNSWIRILTSLGYAKALPVIIAAAGDANEAVAVNAITQLGRWPDPAPMEDLFAVVETGAGPAQRRRALVSVIQLATAAADERQRPDEVVVGWFRRANQAAQSIEHKRLIISGLSRLKHLESFRLLVPHLDDPGVQTEAAMAIVQIAPALTKSEEAAVLKKALEKIAGTVKNADLRNRATNLANTIPGPNKP